MPVIPSFGAFAQTPNVAQSFLGGARISADISQHAAAIQLQRAKLAQDAQQAEIEIAARSAAAERHELRAEQEREIEKSYHLAQIGLKERALKGEEEVLQFKVQEASRMASAQMKYQALFRQYGGDSEAAKRAMLEVGPQTGFTGGMFTQAMKPPQAEIGAASPIEGLPDNFRKVQGSRRIVEIPSANKSDVATKSRQGLLENKIKASERALLAPYIPESRAKVIRETLAKDNLALDKLFQSPSAPTRTNSLRILSIRQRQ